MRSVEVAAFGASDVLRVVERPEPSAGPGELVVDVAAIGVNYMDVYQRQGLGAFRPHPPFVAGNEGAGIVRAVGPDVAEFTTGDRVAWMGAIGAYSEVAVVPAERTLHVPRGLELDLAGGILLQGVTAHYLATSVRAIARGDVAVVHAAAGGVGLLLTQLLVRHGGTVVATTSNREKSLLAQEAGAQVSAGYDDFRSAVDHLTAGRGAAVVYDGVGEATFEESLASLAPRGTLVAYGSTSGPIPPVDVQRLAENSLYLTRPTLAHYAGSRADLVARGSEVLASAADGSLRLHVGARYRLEDAARAHDALESRSTVGKILLLP
ncbi:quinone oxidoreductase family protein [Agromyces kandeliae]|uniref:Zinc-binding dehydrogenase n=1 Tax=Agromyces kandeliae TaxID=2666141 RepID=A0A6L5R7F7_9MICO|nr:quinone oxidoreductase [Agromyces kandeliae]MRX45207.1 zinc-binding dehydrogenase [Agromyces kandeliae]